jgi:hypothetical protein
MTSSNFPRRYARILTIAARFVGAWCLLGGAVFIVSAWVTPTSRAIYICAGIFAVAVGVGLLMASPITGKDKG